MKDSKANKTTQHSKQLARLKTPSKKTYPAPKAIQRFDYFKTANTTIPPKACHQVEDSKATHITKVNKTISTQGNLPDERLQGKQNYSAPKQLARLKTPSKQNYSAPKATQHFNYFKTANTTIPPKACHQVEDSKATHITKVNKTISTLGNLPDERLQGKQNYSALKATRQIKDSKQKILPSTQGNSAF